MTRWIPASLLVLAAVSLSASNVHGGTIIKLGFGGDSLADIELVDGTLSTVTDAGGATTGDQNTEVTFLGALSSQPVIETPTASFTLDGISLTGAPTVFGRTILHATSGGSFQLFGESDELLLSGSLGDGTLSGSIGGTATGGFLTTEFGAFDGGSLLPLLLDNNLVGSSLAISLTDVSGGTGLRITSEGSLANFRADATANLGAAVPEPATGMLVLFGLVAIAVGLRRR